MYWLERLEELAELAGPAGFEDAVMGQARTLLAPYVDETYFDHFGNLVGIRRGSAGCTDCTLLLDAHLDEIGFLVEAVEEGFVRLRPIGGIDPGLLPGEPLRLLTKEPRFAVCVNTPPHLADQKVKSKQIYADLGIIDHAAAKAAVPIGTPAVFARPFRRLEGGFVTGKALDNRAGFVSILYALQQLQGQMLPFHLAVLGSRREEVGGAGASTGAFALKPDVAIAVDVTFGTSPGVSEEESVPLGAGPVVGIGPSLDYTLSERLLKICEGRPHASEPIAGNSGTNAFHIAVLPGGVKTGLISIPLRYMHSPSEVLYWPDVEAVGRLLYDFMTTWEGGDCDAGRACDTL